MEIKVKVNDPTKMIVSPGVVLKGEKGDAGEKGNDGFSPVATITDIDGGHRLTITDASGDKSMDIMNGSGSSLDVTLNGESVVADGVAVLTGLNLYNALDAIDISGKGETLSVWSDYVAARDNAVESKIPTDAHINELIDAKLAEVENGSY